MERELFHSAEQELSLAFSKNQWKVKEEHSGGGYGIRVLSNGRLGFGFCQTESELADTSKQAAALARFSPSSSFSFSSDPAVPAGIQTRTPKLQTLSAEELKSMLDQLRDACQKDTDQVRIHSSLERSTVRLQNPFFDKQYDKNLFQLYVEATVADGFGSYYFSGLDLPPKDWAAIGRETAALARSMRGAGKPPAGSYDVVFAPEAFADLLGLLQPSFSGDWKRRKISVLSDARGKQLFHESIGLYDDGSAPVSGARPFDEEGTPTRKIPLIEQGKVNAFLYDRETAALESVHGDGSCGRSDYSAPPAIGGSNWVINCGDWTSIEAEAREFLLVQSMHGTHTANTTTGEFGVEVSTAFWIQRGERKPVRGFLMIDNIFNLLTRVKGIEKTPQTYDRMMVPRILFGGVRVVS